MTDNKSSIEKEINKVVGNVITDTFIELGKEAQEAKTLEKKCGDCDSCEKEIDPVDNELGETLLKSVKEMNSICSGSKKSSSGVVTGLSIEECKQITKEWLDHEICRKQERSSVPRRLEDLSKELVASESFLEGIAEKLCEDKVFVETLLKTIVNNLGIENQPYPKQIHLYRKEES